MPLCPLPSSCLDGGTWGGQGDVGTTPGITHGLSFLQDLLSYYTTRTPQHSLCKFSETFKVDIRQLSPKAAESLQQQEFISARCSIPMKFHHLESLTATDCQKKTKPEEIATVSYPFSVTQSQRWQPGEVSAAFSTPPLVLPNTATLALTV